MSEEEPPPGKAWRTIHGQRVLVTLCPEAKDPHPDQKPTTRWAKDPDTGYATTPSTARRKRKIFLSKNYRN